MGLSKYFSTSVMVVIIILALSGARLISMRHEKPILFITKQQSSLNIQNDFWQYFNLGQKRLASSIIWISTILESDHDHYNKRDLNSWMFIRFSTISFLEPKFYENYAFGGVYLSIVKDDLKGASIIYDKGLEQYPNDFSLLRDAGFHFYFEVGDFRKSLPIYKKLREFKNPSPIVISTLARLEINDGKVEDAFNLLSDHYLQIKDKESIVATKIRQHLYAIKAEKDLNCLNRVPQPIACSTKDLLGELYVLNAGKFEAKNKWTPFKIKRKNK